MRFLRAPFLVTRIAILVVSILSSAFVLANPASAAHAAPTAKPSARTATRPVVAPAPRTPSGLPSAIEPLGPYVPQSACDPTVRPGTRKLADLLASTYRRFGGTSWASTYACGTDGDPSEHYEGRAIDWMVNVDNPLQHAAALATIKWLLATDAAGNQDAMARRLGVMYLIYDNRIWGSWGGGWQPYNNCAHLKSHAYDNACHRTHIHISLTWNGAMGRTSFWTGKVYPTDYGPCRPADLNWAARYTHPNLVGCPRYPSVVAARGSSATKRSLVEWSGARVHTGSTGPVVTAVQQALHVAATGSYGAVTKAAVQRLQTAHRLPATGVMNQPTWRVLLAATK